jgi:Protein of unknown function (DUF3168)
VSDPAFELQAVMRAKLLAHAPLLSLLGGAHVYDEVPRGEKPLYVAFAGIETRDWSTADQKAHEHFVTLEVTTNARGRKIAQAIVNELDVALHDAPLAPQGHTLVNLRTLGWTVARAKATDNFGAAIRFRAATEPQ